jgi:hypothetical protein
LYADRNPIIIKQIRRFGFEIMLAFLAFTDLLPSDRRSNTKRAIALNELENMLPDLDVDSAQRKRLEGVIAKMREAST